MSRSTSGQLRRARAEPTTVRLIEPSTPALARLMALRASIEAGHVPRVLSFGGGVNSVSLDPGQLDALQRALSDLDGGECLAGVCAPAVPNEPLRRACSGGA